MKEVVIVDNASLVNINYLGEFFFSLMRNIYNQLLIPIEVKNEFEKLLHKEPSRIYILNKLLPNRGFYSLCTYYDSLSSAFLYKYKGIDPGEAEAISQAEKLNIKTIISDDKNFKKALQDLNKNIEVVSTLQVIASLHIHQLLPGNCYDYFSKLFNKHRFKSEDIREAYNASLKKYGINWTKKEISQFSSIKKIRQILKEL